MAAQDRVLPERRRQQRLTLFDSRALEERMVQVLDDVRGTAVDQHIGLLGCRLGRHAGGEEAPFVKAWVLFSKERSR